jgi:Predicted acyl-CoA transferases/carnitine dehydratase
VIQAAAGLMSITGQPDAEGGEPTKVGVAIADVVTGLHGAVALLAALDARDRVGSPAHGRGQRIDVSILESTLAVLVNQAQNAFATGEAPERLGNAHPNIVPYETFATADGRLALAVGSERQWRRLCEALGLDELATDPRFDRNAQRVANRAILQPILAERFADQPTTSWVERLEAAEVPCGAIDDVLTALGSAQAQAREMIVDIAHPRLGPIRQVGVPFKLARTPATIRTAPPLLGEQSAEILAELGYDPPAVSRLREDGVI